MSDENQDVDVDDDLPDAPPLEMVLETFAQIISKPENNTSNTPENRD